VSVAVALADKIDTLTGFWAIDEKPTGSKDPFALRRAALGVIRLVLTNGVRFNFLDRIVLPFSRFNLIEWNGEGKSVAADLLAFFHDRLKVYLRDQGIRHDVIDACLAMPGNDDLTLLVKRAEALAAFLKTDDGENLLQGFKRANNILTQAETKDGVEYSYGTDPKFAETEAERALFAALDAAEAAISPAIEAEDFASAMGAMAALRAPIDAFFEAVQVNAENPVIRRNRLNLLNRIRAICLGVADLGRIEG
jgi:glycyl-tRNA synthetase beta chain